MKIVYFKGDNNKVGTYAHSGIVHSIVGPVEV